MSRPFKIVLVVLLGVSAGIGYLFYAEYKGHEHHHERSRSSAANTLRRMVDGARAYWSDHKAFPANVDYTPAIGACCQSSKKPICQPKDSLWRAPTWSALQFELTKPNAYSYAFETAAKDGTVEFRARARGDLDCDGTLSTFEIFGQVMPDGQLRTSEMFRANELE